MVKTIGQVTLVSFRDKLTQFQQCIRQTSELEHRFVKSTSHFPHKYAGERIPRTSQDTYDTLLSSLETLANEAKDIGLFKENVVSDFIGRSNRNQLLALEPSELDTLLHTYLASVRGNILKLINIDNAGKCKPLSPVVLYGLQEISRNLLVVQHSLRLIEKYPPYFSRETSDALDLELVNQAKLPQCKLNDLSQNDLYNLGDVNLEVAKGMAANLHSQNREESINDPMSQIKLGTKAAQALFLAKQEQANRSPVPC